MIKTVTPIDNTIFVERNFASNTEVEDALENSLIARKNWSNTPLVERKNLVSKFVNSFLLKGYNNKLYVSFPHLKKDKFSSLSCIFGNVLIFDAIAK